MKLEDKFYTYIDSIRLNLCEAIGLSRLIYKQEENNKEIYEKLEYDIMSAYRSIQSLGEIEV